MHAASHWRAIHRPSGEGGEGPAPPSGAPPERPWLRLVGIAVLLPVVVVVALVVNGGSRTRGGPTGAGRGGPVRLAAPPLLARLPAPTPAVQVAAGMAGGSAWSLWVKVSPLDAGRSAAGGAGGGSLPTFGPGLDMEVVTSGSSGGGGGDATRMDSLSCSSYGPTYGFGAELVYGVTSAPAASVQVLLGGSPTPLKAILYTDRHFPGLRFYTAVAPAAADGDRLVAEAFAADGTPLLETGPRLPAPLGG